MRSFVAHQHESITDLDLNSAVTDADLLELTNCSNLHKLAIYHSELSDVAFGYIKVSQ